MNDNIKDENNFATFVKIWKDIMTEGNVKSLLQNLTYDITQETI